MHFCPLDLTWPCDLFGLTGIAVRVTLRFPRLSLKRSAASALPLEMLLLDLSHHAVREHKKPWREVPVEESGAP